MPGRRPVGAAHNSGASVKIACDIEEAAIACVRRESRWRREKRQKRIADKAASDKAKITLAPIRWGPRQ